MTAGVGLDALADISVARMFVRPISLFLTSSGRISLAKGSKILHAEGISPLKKFAQSFTLFLIFIWVSYILALWLSYDYLVSFLGGKYRDIGFFIALWAVFIFIYIVRYTSSNALLICKEFKAMAKFGIYTAAITIASCLLLAGVFQAHGALSSLILGEVVSFFFVAARLRGMTLSADSQPDAIPVVQKAVSPLHKHTKSR